MKPKTTPNENRNDSKRKATPNPEVQMDDAGTAASGNTGMGGQANVAEAAMKQTSKTPAESGDKPKKR